MKKLFFGVVIFVIALNVNAQRPVDTLAEYGEGAADLLFVRGPAKMSKAGPSEDDVGDADSFGRKKTYLGVKQTKPVVIQADCTGSDPESEVCVEHVAPPGTTGVDAPDVATIQLPKKASNSLLCFTYTQFATWTWFNNTGSSQNASMGLFFTTQIENAALNGLNDLNGNPFNGSLFLDGTGVPSPVSIVVATRQTTLPDGAFETQRDRVTRSCTGGIVSASSLRAQGLTDGQVKDFFDAPMTITFGVAGSVRMTDFVSYFGGIRLYGD